ncbi:MAG: NTP transferase domain-containing protein [Candidatus Hydrothermarchaeota archaeon]|nr:NTP transferase domain-containing protein [Candidatus Hydrothermarchaeota archaeon]
MKLNALVMAGGRGGRLKVKEEKPLLIFDGKPLIEYVLEALKNSKYIDKIFVAASKNAQKTEQEMRKKAIAVISAPGRGYVEDMLFALKKLKLGKTLVISADLPLLHSKDIDWVVEEYFKQKKASLAVFVPEETFKKHKLVPSIVINGCVPAGVNIVDSKNLSESEARLVSEKLQFALNINTLKDLKTAKSIIRTKKRDNHARK